MSKKGKVEADKIHIVDFTIESASLKSEFGIDDELIEHHNLNIEYDTLFNLEEKLVKANITVTVKALDAKKKQLGYGEFNLTYVYHIENLDKLTEVVNDKELSVNGGLSNSLASITYSTTRGILMTRFQGTLLQSFILPVINPNELLDD